MSLESLFEKVLQGDYNPSQAIADSERASGFRVIKPGEAPWLPAKDWNEGTVCSIDGMYARLVLIDAKMPGTGALTRTLAAIKADRLIPCIVDPTRELAATLSRRGWKSKQHGSTFEDRETRWTP